MISSGLFSGVSRRSFSAWRVSLAMRGRSSLGAAARGGAALCPAGVEVFLGCEGLKFFLKSLR